MYLKFVGEKRQPAGMKERERGTRERERSLPSS